ncbi:unnamed protein product [Blumeria hordei]|uniref:Uncharacterized protein n=1 Tax=Blumeria hordei TaxID=2867405 RepID=A0A383UKK8_BLUHO|nr:unnamed protein product [Blumeria hordei]
MEVVPLSTSPTLTNPDMILPFKENDELSLAGRWTENLNDNQYSGGFALSDSSAMSLRTSFMYGNGTMLSDIGEVTEVEGTPGGKFSDLTEKRALKLPTNDVAYRLGQTTGKDALTRRFKSERHQRNISLDSTSTEISREQSAEMFKDLTDTASVDDSVFLGDDEESVADSDEEMVSYQSQISNEYGLPSLALSRKAEQILLSAKKRLHTMEDNLNRARISVPIRPNTSHSGHSSSSYSLSNPSPSPDSFQNPRVVDSMSWKLRAKYDMTGERSIKNEDSREKLSFTKVPSKANSSIDSSSRSIVKSSSFTSTSAHELDGWQGIPRPLRSLAVKTASRTDSPSRNSEIPGSDTDRTVRKSTSGEELNHNLESKDFPRSASSLQMRDLQTQMQGLKGRLSILRDRTRDDTMRRRSLQSLKNSDPGAIADKWYAMDKNFPSQRSSSLKSQSCDSANQSPVESGEDTTTRGSRSNLSRSSLRNSFDGIEDYQEPEANEANQKEPSDITEDNSAQVTEVEIDSPNQTVIKEKDEDDDCDESSSSIYHDTMVSHEDREDAFDYEHFFLHSAMGTISQERRESVSSQDSAETARCYSPQKRKWPSKSRKSQPYRRSASTESISTLESFSTANEVVFSPSSSLGDTGDYSTEWSTQTQAQRDLTSLNSTFDHENTRPNFSKTGSPFTPGYGDKCNQYLSRRSSIESFDSVVTFKSSHSTKNFPPLKNSDIASPNSHPIDQVSSLAPSQLVSEANINRPQKATKPCQESPVDMLAIDDQVLVKRLVVSLGKCVLGLQEARTSIDIRLWRRRLDAARRVLDGVEGAV